MSVLCIAWPNKLVVTYVRTKFSVFLLKRGLNAATLKPVEPNKFKIYLSSEVG